MRSTNAGIAEHIVQKMGNWKDRRMLARYAHLGDENLRQAESDLTRLLQASDYHNTSQRGQRVRRAKDDQETKS